MAGSCQRRLQEGPEFESHDPGRSWTGYAPLLGKPAESLEPSRKALAVYQALVDKNPANTPLPGDLANLHNNIGQALGEIGKPAEAMGVASQGIGHKWKLADAKPANADFQEGLGCGHNFIGVVLASTGKPTEAQEPYRRRRWLFFRRSRRCWTLQHE